MQPDLHELYEDFHKDNHTASELRTLLEQIEELDTQGIYDIDMLEEVVIVEEKREAIRSQIGVVNRDVLVNLYTQAWTLLTNPIQEEDVLESDAIFSLIDENLPSGGYSKLTSMIENGSTVEDAVDAALSHIPQQICL